MVGHREENLSASAPNFHAGISDLVVVVFFLKGFRLVLKSAPCDLIISGRTLPGISVVLQ